MCLCVFSRQYLSLSTFQLLHHHMRTIFPLLLLHVDFDIVVDIDMVCGPSTPNVVVLAMWRDVATRSTANQIHGSSKSFDPSYCPLHRCFWEWFLFFGGLNYSSGRHDQSHGVWSLASIILPVTSWFYNQLGFYNRHSRDLFKLSIHRVRWWALVLLTIWRVLNHRSLPQTQTFHISLPLWKMALFDEFRCLALFRLHLLLLYSISILF